MKHNQFGRSMIEMLGVLAIIGVLSVGGIAGYSKAMTKFKINKTIDEVATIVNNIRTLYANQKYIDDLSYWKNLQIVKDFIFPAETWVGGIESPFNHALGGAIDVTTYPDYNTFFISLDGLSKEACTTLAAYDWGVNSSGFAAIVVMEKMASDPGAEILDCQDEETTADYFSNEKGAVTSCRRVHNLPLPLPPDLAAKGCACTTNTCAIEILFK